MEISNEDSNLENKIFSAISPLELDSSLMDKNILPTADVVDNQMWTGLVVDNEDPLKLGRVRVKIFGRYDNIPSEHLPWAIPQSDWLGSQISNLVVPETGSVIRGIFEKGDLYRPIYTSRITVSDPEENSSEAYNGTRPIGEIVRDEASSEDYPQTMILLNTSAGESVTLNRKTGKTQFKHRSGLTITIDGNGTISITQIYSRSPNSEEPAALELDLEGKVSLVAKDDISISCNGNVSIDSVMGEVQLGKNQLKQLVCAHPVCFVTGAPTTGGNTNVTA